MADVLAFIERVPGQREGCTLPDGLHMAGDAARGALRFCAIGANGVMLS